MYPIHRPERLDDSQLTRYLLGMLPDAEAEWLDEASIVDDEFATRLRLVEDDLVDAYVRGTLSGELLRRFEAGYLASPRRRHNLKFAEGFVRAIDRADVTSESPSSSRRPGRAFRAPTLIAAAAVALVACGALALHDLALRNGLKAARQESLELNRRALTLEDRLNQERRPTATVSQEPHGAEHPSPPVVEPRQPAPALSAALVLLPQTRAIAPIPALAITRSAQRVTFGLQLESNDFPRYEVALKDPASNEVAWRSAPLTTTTRGQASIVYVVVPGRMLKPQHYSLDLSGVPASGNREIVGSYVVQILSR